MIAPEVGGGFGAKFMIYPEEIVVPAVARKLGRAVKWVEDRREHFLSAIQERDQYWSVEFAADARGQILGVRGEMVHDHGAYTPQGTNVPYNSASSLSGPYLVPACRLQVSVVHTNKVPVATVRGAGYPQAAFVMERVLDRIAQGVGIDRAECRRRNLIPADQIPYVKPLKSRAGVPLTIDSGDFPALQRARWPRSAMRNSMRAGAGARGCRGIGLANGVKPTGRGPFESARVRIAPSGQISVYTGALAMGQGIATTLAQLCAAHFGVAAQAVQVRAGDTAFVSHGMGGFASRQAMMAGSAVTLAAGRVRAIRSAAALLGVEEDCLLLADGEIKTPDGRAVSLARLATLWKGVPGYALPGRDDPGLDETAHFHCDAQSYAGASHACEVEVDPGTGRRICCATWRCTTAAASSIPCWPAARSTAAWRTALATPCSSGWAMTRERSPSPRPSPSTCCRRRRSRPHRRAVPAVAHHAQSPGRQGIGECATVPVAAAVIGAVEDALRAHGVRIAEFPLTPMRLLALIDQGRGSIPGDC